MSTKISQAEASWNLQVLRHSLSFSRRILWKCKNCLVHDDGSSVDSSTKHFSVFFVCSFISHTCIIICSGEVVCALKIIEGSECPHLDSGDPGWSVFSSNAHFCGFHIILTPWVRDLFLWGNILMITPRANILFPRWLPVQKSRGFTMLDGESGV